MRCLAVFTLFLYGFSPLPALALVNGGFESSLTGWTVFPATGVNPIRATTETAAFGITPTEGRAQGVIETSDIDGANAAEIESFFGLAAGAISGLGFSSPRGIAISQSVNVAPGDVLRGDINFLTNELVQGDPGYTTNPAFDDFAILVADGLVHLLADVNDPGFFMSNALLRGGSSVTGVTNETGYLPLSYAFQSIGVQTIGFAVFNVSDIGNQSALAMDDLRIEPIPLPAAGDLLIAALLGLGMSRARQRPNP